MNIALFRLLHGVYAAIKSISELRLILRSRLFYATELSFKNEIVMLDVPRYRDLYLQ